MTLIMTNCFMSFHRTDIHTTMVQKCWSELFTLGLAQCCQSMALSTILTAIVNHLQTSLQQGKWILHNTGSHSFEINIGVIIVLLGLVSFLQTCLLWFNKAKIFLKLFRLSSSWYDGFLRLMGFVHCSLHGASALERTIG